MPLGKEYDGMYFALNVLSKKYLIVFVLMRDFDYF